MTSGCCFFPSIAVASITLLPSYDHKRTLGSNQDGIGHSSILVKNEEDCCHSKKKINNVVVVRKKAHGVPMGDGG